VSVRFSSDEGQGMKYLALTIAMLAATAAHAGTQTFSEVDTYSTHDIGCSGKNSTSFPGFSGSAASLAGVTASISISCDITVTAKFPGFDASNYNDQFLNRDEGEAAISFGKYYEDDTIDETSQEAVYAYDPMTQIVTAHLTAFESSGGFLYGLSSADAKAYEGKPIAFDGAAETYLYLGTAAGDIAPLTITNNITLTSQAEYLYSAVPEPASWAMVLGGIGFVGGVMRNRGRVAIA
jgi:hypothetical protein